MEKKDKLKVYLGSSQKKKEDGNLISPKGGKKINWLSEEADINAQKALSLDEGKGGGKGHFASKEGPEKRASGGRKGGEVMCC